MLPFVPANNPAVARAQALAADLRYLFRKHRARVVWREELDGRVTVGLTLENQPEGGALAAALGPRSPLWLAALSVLMLLIG